MNIVLKLLIQYVEAHPDQVVELATQAAEAGINALKKHNAAQKAA